MIFILIILILSSTAVTASTSKSIVYSRLSMEGVILSSYIIYINMHIKPLEREIGLYGNLFNINLFTQSFNIFMFIIAGIILILTSFYPRDLYFLESLDPESRYHLMGRTDVYHSMEKARNLIRNKKSNQYTIIEYGLIIVFILCGATFLISASDLISIFLSIELQSYGLYILSTLYRNSETATGSGLKYFLLGGLSSCFILFGSAFIYSNSGTTTLDNMYIINTINESNIIGSSVNANFNLKETLGNNIISDYWYSSYYITVSFIIFMVGFLFKISAAPFHFWSPDVYDGIPTIVTTFVAIVAKISIFAFIMRLTLQLGSSDTVGWKDVFIFSSLMSLVIGSILGLTQSRIKRLFAYSTISHVGFILLALSITSIESIQGYIFYILQYSITNLNAFFILISIGFTLSMWIDRSSPPSRIYRPWEEHLKPKVVTPPLPESDNSPIQLISQLKGFFYANTFIAVSLAITLFSFVGIPPLIGFFAKQIVLSAALDSGYTFMAIIGIITSVIAAVYYLNLVKEIFFYSPYRGMQNINRSNQIEDFGFWFADSSYTSHSKGDLYYIFSQTDKSKDNYNTPDIYMASVNNVITIFISILTMTILTFIYVPNDWFTVAKIISITLFNL